MNTPTPRTNRAWNACGGDTAEAAWSFARKLESELAIETERATHYRDEWQKERAKVRTLHSALQNLADEQNGAPLERRREQWQATMDEARAALAATEEKQ